MFQRLLFCGHCEEDGHQARDHHQGRPHTERESGVPDDSALRQAREEQGPEIPPVAVPMA